MIQVKSLSKIFQDGGHPVVALSGVELNIAKGECVMIGGPSGCGKTTLLNIIGCLSRPSLGEVFIDNTKVSDLPDHFLCEIRRNKIGFIFQQFNLLSGYTAVENAGMPLVPLGMPRVERHKLASSMLDCLGLSHRLDFPVTELSGGEQQRVAIARALMNDPEVIIADEPTSSVDRETAGRIVDLLSGLIKKGKTVVLSSHDKTLARELEVTRTYELEQGRIK